MLILVTLPFLLAFFEKLSANLWSLLWQDEFIGELNHLWLVSDNFCQGNSCFQKDALEIRNGELIMSASAMPPGSVHKCKTGHIEVTDLIWPKNGKIEIMLSVPVSDRMILQLQLNAEKQETAFIAHRTKPELLVSGVDDCETEQRFEKAPATTLTDGFHLLAISWQDGGVFFSLDNEVYFPQDEQVSFSQPVSFSVHIFCELTEFTNITAPKPTVEFDYIRVYTSTDSKSLNSEILKASGNDLIQTEDKFSNNLFFWTGLGGAIFIVAVLIAAVCFKRTRNTGNWQLTVNL